jgi:trehalose 6-phosphate synthase
MRAWQAEIGCTSAILGIGIDRIDYTKGIPERLAAIDALFERHPEYIGGLTFVQVGVPSRTAIAEYHALNERIAAEVEALNRRWSRGKWKPVVFIHRHVDQKALIALHLLADFCLVSSLDDGMNLVAKEFVASRIDEDGVLVLSAFAGAAQELPDALIVNPFAPEEMAEAIHAAVSMPAPERRARMARMRGAVAVNNVYRWAGKLLSTLVDLESAGGLERTAKPAPALFIRAGVA